MLCNHSFFDEHLGCFQFWAILNDAAMPICVQVFAWTYAKGMSGRAPRRLFCEGLSAAVIP